MATDDASARSPRFTRMGTLGDVFGDVFGEALGDAFGDVLGERRKKPESLGDLVSSGCEGDGDSSSVKEIAVAEEGEGAVDDGEDDDGEDAGEIGRRDRDMAGKAS